MNLSTFELLCEASQLSFSHYPEEKRENFKQRLDCMIEFAGAVKNFDCVFDETAGESVSLDDLREDITFPSLPAEKLLANTEPLFDCYVIPKIME
jgi:Asp-tRNA(Asn)/Glu-tRNA(Gln) amidotransferase C subunit